MRNLTFPLLASIQITDACNCDCKYCYNVKRHNRFLSENDFNLALDTIVNGHVFHVILEGGEPLLHKNLFKFCKGLLEAKLDYTIITNATLITPGIAKELSDLRCNVIVSLDSAEPQIHNKTRDNGDAALAGIDFLLSANVPVGINTVISIHNVDSCTDIIKYFYPKIKRFSFLKLIHRSQNDETIDTLYSYSQEQFGALGVSLGNYKKQLPEIKIISPFNFPNDDKRTFQESLDAPGCLAGTTYITIKPNLDIIPCSYVQNLVVGNLRESQFETIWKGQALNALKSASALPCSMNRDMQGATHCSLPGMSISS